MKRWWNFRWLTVLILVTTAAIAEEADKPFCGLSHKNLCIKGSGQQIQLYLTLPSLTADPKPYHSLDLHAGVEVLRALMDDVYGNKIRIYTQIEELQEKLKQTPKDPELQKQVSALHEEFGKAEWSDKALRKSAPYQVQTLGNSKSSVSERLKEHKARLDKVLEYLTAGTPKPAMSEAEEGVLVNEFGLALQMVGTIGFSQRLIELREFDQYEHCDRKVYLQEKPQIGQGSLAAFIFECQTRRKSSTEKIRRDSILLDLSGPSPQVLVFDTHEPERRAGHYQASPFYSTMVWVTEGRKQTLMDFREGKPIEVTVPKIPVEEVRFLPEGQFLFGNKDILYVYLPTTLEVKEIFRRTGEGYDRVASPRNLIYSPVGWLYRDGQDLYRVNLVGGTSQKFMSLTKEDQILSIAGGLFFHSHTLQQKGKFEWVDSFRSMDKEGKLSETTFQLNEKSVTFKDLPPEVQAALQSSRYGETGIPILGKSASYSELFRLACVNKARDKDPGQSCWIIGQNYGKPIALSGPELSANEQIVSAGFAKGGSRLMYITRNPDKGVSQAHVLDVQGGVKKMVVPESKYIELVSTSNYSNDELTFLVGDGAALYQINADATRQLMVASTFLPENFEEYSLLLSPDRRNAIGAPSYGQSGRSPMSKFLLKMSR